MSRLIQKAEEIYSSLNIGKLEAQGFKRDVRTYEYIVTYPPVRALGEITQQEVCTKPINDTQFYVHIPFCKGPTSCTFCGRYEKFVDPSPEFVSEYLGYLERETEIMSKLFGEFQVQTMYFGGGTPTYLEPEQLERLINSLNRTLAIQRGAEFTVEGHPRTITERKLEVLLYQGVNRFSLGVQDYHDDTLDVCKRRHTKKEAMQSTAMILKAGLINLNIDLMTGLPYQTLERFEENLRIFGDSGAVCTTIYPMYIRPGCEISGSDTSVLPTMKENILMQIMAKEFFKEKGWTEGPIHYYAALGIVTQRQNERKWSGAENIGIGLSVYQFANNCQFHNTFNFDKYKRLIDQGKLPIGMGKVLDRREQMARSMVLGMKKGTLDIRAFYAKFGEHPESVYPETIQRLKDLGLVVNTTDEHEIVDKLGSLSLTFLAELFSEEIALKFYTEKTKQAIGQGGYCCYSIAELPQERA